MKLENIIAYLGIMSSLVIGTINKSILAGDVVIISDRLKMEAECESMEQYPALIKEVGNKRLALLEEYINATQSQKKEIKEKSKEYLFNIFVNKIFPAWYGTPWDFNGSTECPKEGIIACGYFVGNTLRHAGFNFDKRIGMLISEDIIRNLIEPRYIKRFWKIAVDKFENDMKSMGDGIYIIGLGHTAGFLVVSKGEVRFVHSAHHKNKFVLEEGLESEDIVYSPYKVVGRLLNDEVIEKWIRGERFPLKYISTENERKLLKGY
ncbi:hypothetical protein HZB88_04705 [archaeon]|nr:hypothetical protein [archaeon]